MSESEQLTLMFYVEDSHVRTSVTETPTEKDLMATAQGCGENLPESFARLNQDGLWSKTSSGYSQLTLEGTLEEYLQTWPDAGMMLHGMCYERPTLERHIDESESFLLPTATANESKGSSRDRYFGSPNFRGAKMSEGLRISEDDPIYLNPSFAELAMGFPLDWTLLEMP